MASSENRYPGVISTRDVELKKRLERLVELEDRNVAQMTRILLRKAVQQREEEMGLPPLDGFDEERKPKLQ